MEHRSLAEHDWGRLKSDRGDDGMGTGMTHTAQQMCVASMHIKDVSWRVGGFMPFVSVCMCRESCILLHHLTSHLVCKQIWLIGSVKSHLLWHCHWAFREKAVRNAPLLVHALETEFSWPFRVARKFSDSYSPTRVQALLKGIGSTYVSLSKSMLFYFFVQTSPKMLLWTLLLTIRHSTKCK